MVINEFILIAIGICAGVLLMALADVIDAKNKKY